MPKEGPGEAQGKSKEASLVNCPTFLVPKLFCCQASSRPIFSVRGLIFSDVFIVKLPCPNVPPPLAPMFLFSSLISSNLFCPKPGLLRCFSRQAPLSQCPTPLVPMFLFSSLISSDLFCPRPGLLRCFYCPTSSLRDC